MQTFSKTTKSMAAMAAVFIALLFPVSVGATPTILVDPYDNLSLTGTSVLDMTGGGLTPGVTITAIQKSFGPGGVLENKPLGVVGVVSAAGDLTGTVSVTYDARPDLSTLNYCNTISAEQKLCVVEFRYANDFTNVILQQKLYFGMADPTAVPPTPAVPVTKDDCKDDRWDSFTSLGFKNQGACVNFVANKQ